MVDDSVGAQVGRLYAAHRQELFTYALSITRSYACAEDAVHESFRRLLALRRLPRELRPYVFRCVRNASLDVLRSAERDQQKLAHYQILFDESADPHQKELVADLLATLSDKEREIVVLKLFSGLTFREIAEVCSARQGTVAASYWRSLQKLRGHLNSTEEPARTLEDTP